MDGLLLVDKPKGWTSFDVVAKVRGLLQQAQKERMLGIPHLDAVQGSQEVRKIRVGHTGTLDPLATGLLVITVGSYCKRAQEFSKLGKTYEVTMKLGETSTTADDEGEKTSVSDKQPPKEEVEAALRSFVGEIMQTPPIYSAIKVGGKRAYKLAREGKEVKLEPRPVAIHSIDLTDYTYPFVRFTAHVSSGTYIRSLVEDIGKKLGTGAYMSDLRRTTVGNFTIDHAQQVDVLTGTVLQNSVVRLA